MLTCPGCGQANPEGGTRFVGGQLALSEYVIGDWDAFGPLADELIPESESGSTHCAESALRVQRAIVRAARDDVTGAASDLHAGIGLARAQRDPRELMWALGAAVLPYEETGREPRLRSWPLNAPNWPTAFACLDGDYVAAADLYSKAGSRTLEARLPLRAAEELATTGRFGESRMQAQRALEFHREAAASRPIGIESRLLRRSA